jgi:hypothetical protein
MTLLGERNWYLPAWLQRLPHPAMDLHAPDGRGSSPLAAGASEQA